MELTTEGGVMQGLGQVVTCVILACCLCFIYMLHNLVFMQYLGTLLQ